jgi:hypothetical protein
LYQNQSCNAEDQGNIAAIQAACRPAAGSIPVSPDERNSVEGKFGQGKTAYGLSKIRARLKETSESWIASIFLVLNLVKLAWAALPCLFEKIEKVAQNLTAYLLGVVEILCYLTAQESPARNCKRCRLQI